MSVYDKIQPADNPEAWRDPRPYEYATFNPENYKGIGITPTAWGLVLEICSGIANYEPSFVPGHHRCCAFCKFTDFGLPPLAEFPHAPSCPVSFARMLRESVIGE